MLDATSKALFHGLAQVPTLQRLASKYGMAPGSGFARRFIAGETIDEAVEWARRCPDPMPGEKAELEIRPIFEADDLGKEFTPELRAQDERLRAQIERQATR